MSTPDETHSSTVLLIATFDAKAEEALYLKDKIVSLGCDVLLTDTGILDESVNSVDFNRNHVAEAE
jgi:uncharacterized protein (UPF0261 family)